MNFKLEREKTTTTPYVLIDEENKYMKFEGKSYLEEIVEFFQEISEWLEKYLAQENAGLTFDCAMRYFNSSTTKIIYNMLRVMDKAAGRGAEITVNWIVSEANESMVECGEDFEEEMENLTFNLVIEESE